MTDSVDADTARLRARLASCLNERGVLNTPSLRAAFEAVPREVFVPSFVLRREQEYVRFDANIDHEAWLDQLYRDQTLITVVDAGGTAVSSSTMPMVMALMLEALKPCDGMSVLELGTGTGYNTALLCHLVGDRNVSSVDIDPELVDLARGRLASIGCRPRLAVADATATSPPEGRYDRIIITFGVRRLPPGAVHQLATGGIVVANVRQGLIALTANSDSTAMHGRFQRQRISFMRALVDASALPTPHDAVALTHNDAERSHAVQAPNAVDIDGAWFVAQLLLPGVDRFPPTDIDGRSVYRLVDHASGSWVRVDLTDTPRATVAEGGPKRLWHEFADAVSWWQSVGRPEPERLGLTVAMDGSHTLWLDTPDSPHRRTL